MIKALIGNVPVLGWRAKGSLNGDRPRLRREGRLLHHVLGAMQFLKEMEPPRQVGDDDIVFDLRPDAEAFHWARSWIAGNVPRGMKLMAVAPGSIQPHKRWPIEKFVDLTARLLHEEPSLCIVVLGTPADTSLAEALMRVNPARVFDLAGKSSISQSAALLTECALLVGNDGGAMHLGDAMGTRVVSIVPGLEYPDSIEPWNNRRRAIRHSVECAPCYDFLKCPLGHNKCMVDLPLERVLANCRAALAETTIAETNTADVRENAS
jgi:heptosyltransferase-2